MTDHLVDYLLLAVLGVALLIAGVHSWLLQRRMKELLRRSDELLAALNGDVDRRER